jgi:hypothetical protein
LLNKYKSIINSFVDSVMSSTEKVTHTDYLSHTFFLDTAAISFGYQVPRIHVTVHAHGNAFLKWKTKKAKG